jgi:uncharacterized phage-associated protein
MYSAGEIAATILIECYKRGIEVSNLKLQKLLYYAEAWNLALGKGSLFTETLEAWVHGPVTPGVFRSYKDFRWSPITNPRTEGISDESIVEHINTILDAYGSFHATELERLTHNEKPWLEAREGLEPDEPSTRPISRETMAGFYAEQAT